MLPGIQQPQEYAGTLDNLLKDIEKPRQNFEASAPPPLTDEQRAEMPNQPPDYSETEILSHQDAATSAQAITSTTDAILSVSLGMYAKSSDYSQYQATAQERQNLNRAFTRLCAKRGWQVPPEVDAAAAVFQIYVPKFINAKQEREINLLKQEMQEIKARQDKIEEKQNSKAE